MRDNVKILGILNIVIGSLGLLAAIGIFALFTGIAGVLGFSHDADAVAPAGLLAGLGVVIGTLIVLLSLPQIIGGWGLTTFKPWARTLMIVISIINLLHVPIGTALGVYGLWVLFSDETRRLFETGGVPAVPGFGYAAPVGYGQAYPGQPPAQPYSPPAYPPPLNRPPDPPAGL